MPQPEISKHANAEIMAGELEQIPWLVMYEQMLTICFFGDGALGQGMLYEVMNMASLWQLPVIYVCENNQYNEYTHNSETTAGEMSARARAFGILTEELDGQDIRAIYSTAQRLVKRAREGQGPAFMLCNTYRYFGHHVGDIH